GSRLSALLRRLRLLIVLLVGIGLVLGPQRLGSILREQNVNSVGDFLRVAKIQPDVIGRVARGGRPVQLFDDGDDRIQVFLRIGGDDQGVGGRDARDAHLAIEAAHVAVGGRRRVFAEIIEVGLLLGLFQKEVVQNVFQVAGADVFQRNNFWRQRTVA